MRKSTTKTLTFLASMIAVVTLGMATAALALAEPGKPPVISNQPLDNTPDNIVDVDGPLDPVGPVDPDPKPDPDPVDTDSDPADPKPVDPDKVIVLKPGQDPAEVVAGGAFTGEAVFEHMQDGEEKVVLVIAGRTVDDHGNPVPGAAVAVVVDRHGVVSKVIERSAKDEAMERGCRPAIQHPHVQGFSDANGDFRLRLTYYAKPGSKREAWLRATRKGFVDAAIESVDVSRDRDDVELQLGIAASLTGRCVDEYGNPIAGVAVYAWGDNVGAQGTTDADGRFVLEGLRGGDVHISCWSEKYLYVATEELFHVVSGRENDIGRDLQLATRSSLGFRMDFAGAEDSEWLNGTIEFYDTEGKVQFMTYVSGTKEQGYRVHAIIDNLPEGTWNMKVTVGGNKSWQAELTVSVSIGVQVDLGTIYFMESDAPSPKKFVEPCCG